MTFQNILIFLLFPITSFSQKPFGKNFSIIGNQGFSMLNYISEDFVGHTKLSVNYRLNKSFMLGIDGNYTYAKYSKHVSSNNITNYIWSDPPEIDDYSLGITFSYFRSKTGSMAPQGRYFFISSAFGLSNKYYYTVENSQGGNNEEILRYFMNEDLKMKSLIVNIGYGRNYIVYKRLILGYRLDFGLDLLNKDKNSYRMRYLMRPSIQIGYTF